MCGDDAHRGIHADYFGVGIVAVRGNSAVPGSCNAQPRVCGMVPRIRGFTDLQQFICARQCNVFQQSPGFILASASCAQNRASYPSASVPAIETRAWSTSSESDCISMAENAKCSDRLRTKGAVAGPRLRATRRAQFPGGIGSHGVVICRASNRKGRAGSKVRSRGSAGRANLPASE